MRVLRKWITVVHTAINGSRWFIERMQMQGNKQRAPSPVLIPEELKLWLKHKAVDNFRSFNSEIVARLEESRKAEEARNASAA